MSRVDAVPREVAVEEGTVGVERRSEKRGRGTEIRKLCASYLSHRGDTPRIPGCTVPESK